MTDNNNGSKEQVWLRQGYSMFASGGPGNLKIEVLADRVGKSKSSFYHFFADTIIFQEELLRHHRARVTELIEKERRMKSIDPEIIDLMVESKEDLFFHRQLRLNRQVREFDEFLKRIDPEMEAAFIPLWAKLLGVQERSVFASLFLRLCLENFFLSLSTDTFSPTWLRKYFSDVRHLVQLATQQGKLDATV